MMLLFAPAIMILLAVSLWIFKSKGSLESGNVSLVTEEIRYSNAEVGQVDLVWGIRNWEQVAVALRPEGTFIQDNVMHTPMILEGQVFVSRISVPAWSTVKYGFLVTRDRNGNEISPVLEKSDNYEFLATERSSIVEVESQLAISNDENGLPLLNNSAPLRNLEIRYHMSDAAEALLTWGINGWQVADESLQPEGTEIVDGLMHTPMSQVGDGFRVNLQLPANTTLDYGFLVTRVKDGSQVNIWEAGKENVFPEEGQVIDFESKVKMENGLGVARYTTSLVRQDFSYKAPEAGEVMLVWGVNGWFPLPEADRPVGTLVIDGKMQLPMAHAGDTFTASVQAPVGQVLDYGFLITKNNLGEEVSIWESDPSQAGPLIPWQAGAIDIESGATLNEEGGTPSILEIVQPLVVAFILAFGIIFLRRKVPAKYQGPLVAAILLGVLLLGLYLRVFGAGTWNSYHPNSAERLIGDEPGYDNIARELLMGLGFTWPGRVPLYPIWLAGVYLLTGGSYNAVPYVQSLLGLATIALTFILAKKLVGVTAALIAASWAAVSFVLIHQSFHFLSEVLYTPVLLLVALSLWKALLEPDTKHFIWAGFWVGVSNLVRPTLLFFPAVIVLILLVKLNLRKALKFWIVYLATSFLVVTPWIIHNYIRFDAIIPLQTSNAILWQGSPEYYHLVNDENYTYYEVWSEILYGPGWEAHDPNSVAGDRYWTRRALTSIAAEPFVYLKYGFEKFVYFWVGDPHADWGETSLFNYQGLRRAGFLPKDAIQVILARALPILAFGAVLFQRKRWRLFLPLFGILLYFNLLHAITHAEARLSEPLQPFLLIFIAGAWVEILARRQGEASSDQRVDRSRPAAYRTGVAERVSSLRARESGVKE